MVKTKKQEKLIGQKRREKDGGGYRYCFKGLYITQIQSLEAIFIGSPLSFSLLFWPVCFSWFLPGFFFVILERYCASVYSPFVFVTVGQTWTSLFGDGLLTPSLS